MCRSLSRPRPLPYLRRSLLKGKTALATTIGATPTFYSAAPIRLLAELPFGEAAQSPTGPSRVLLGFEETVSVLDVGYNITWAGPTCVALPFFKL